MADPDCPGPDCPLCNGAACEKCGAGATRNPSVDGVRCDHDTMERHEPPAYQTEVKGWVRKHPIVNDHGVIVVLDPGLDDETRQRYEEAVRDLPMNASDDQIRDALQRMGWNVSW